MNALPAANVLPREFEPDARVSAPPWLALRRAQALQEFQTRGIPHRRVEEWKYSDLRNVLEAPYESGGEAAPEFGTDHFAAIAGYRIAIRDGRFDAEAADRVALPAGIELVDLGTLGADAPDWVIRNLGQALCGGALGQASLALMRGGVAIRVACDLDAPIHLRFLQSASAAHSRVLIVVERGASLDLLESHPGATGLANIGFETVLESGSLMLHTRLAGAGPDTVLIEEIGIRVAKDARYRGHFSQT
ncbi:MAG TPA: hypothetical protein VIY09_08265, partial [Rhizomicrobium sp.]